MGLIKCDKHGLTVSENVCRHIAASVVEIRDKRLELVLIVVEIDPDDVSDVDRYLICSICAETYGIPKEGYRVKFDELMLGGDICLHARNQTESVCAVCLKDKHSCVEKIFIREGFDTNKIFQILRQKE